MRFSKIFRFTLGKRILAIKINAWNQELHTHYGITNEVPDTKLFIPFWDFKEDIPLDKISDGLKRMQDEEFLSTIYIIQTTPKESYRAFSLDQMGFLNYIAILAGTENIDPSYLRHTVMRGRAVIRVSEKDGTLNKIVKVLHPSDYPDMLSSSLIHHQRFFSAIYPEVPKPKYTPDKIKVRISKYESFR